ncbi:hypothetical protein [Caldimonas sp. KR1-144]|uniref:hypothetical protein n=1 Tax=Caldimonas sp. KR1-144 TaxID=3400911 RepID=UPI003C1254C4
MSAPWLARSAAFFGWAAVAASAVYWVLRTTVSAPGLPPDALPVSGTAAVRGDVARLFVNEVRNAPVAEPALASRFKLLGVVAPRAGGEGGVALIAVDGKPPRAVRVGASVDGDWLLQSVAARTASIGAQGAAPAVELSLPPPTPAATGTLPPATPPGAPPPAPPSPAAVQAPPTGEPPGLVPGAPPPTAVMPSLPRGPVGSGGAARRRGEAASAAR